MKRLLYIIFTLFAINAAAQCPSGPLPAVGGPKDKWHVKYYLTSDSIMVVPQDTITTTCWTMGGAIAYKGGTFWKHSNTGWWETLTSGSGGSGTVTSVATGWGALGGPFTTTGTIIGDSSILLYNNDTLPGRVIEPQKHAAATYLKITDTTGKWQYNMGFLPYTKTEVNTIANLRLLISDTTNMLAPYLPRWLAATTYLSQASAALNYVPVTDLSTAADPSKVIQRTSDANAYANNFVPNTATITASGTTRVLTAASARTQQVTGTGSQVYQLPVSTTLVAGWPFEFDNNATGTVTVNNSAGTTLFTIPSGGYTVVKLMVVGGGGTWDFHSTIPANSSWGTAGANITGNVTADTAFAKVALSNIYPAPATTDSTVFQTKYRSDTGRTNTLAYIATKGSGTVTSVAGGSNLLGGTITTSGTLYVDTSANHIATKTDLTAKQTTLNGTGFVKASGTTISYDNSTYITQNQTISDVGNGDVTWSTSGTNTLTKTTAIKSSVALAGSPTTTTQSAGDSSTKIATTAYVDVPMSAIQTQTTVTTSYTTSVTITSTTANTLSTVSYKITAQAGALLFNNPSGSWQDGQIVIFRVKDNGTIRALTYGTDFSSGMLSATVVGKWANLEFMYNSSATHKFQYMGGSYTDD